MPRQTRITKDHELRVEDGANGPVLTGYAALFNKKSVDMGFREIIRPGAFDDTLAEGADVRALFNHDSSQVLGRTPDTLTLEANKRGLKYSAELPDTQAGRDVVTLVSRGDVRGSSFGFQVRGFEGEQWNDDYTERELLSVDLFDVSPVTFPAYPATESTLAIRCMQEWREAVRANLMALNRMRLTVAEAEARV